jgi:hypothetical protein
MAIMSRRLLGAISLIQIYEIHHFPWLNPYFLDWFKGKSTGNKGNEFLLQFEVFCKFSCHQVLEKEHGLQPIHHYNISKTYIKDWYTHHLHPFTANVHREKL